MAAADSHLGLHVQASERPALVVGAEHGGRPRKLHEALAHALAEHPGEVVSRSLAQQQHGEPQPQLLVGERQTKGVRDESLDSVDVLHSRAQLALLVNRALTGDRIDERGDATGQAADRGVGPGAEAASAETLEQVGRKNELGLRELLENGDRLGRKRHEDGSPGLP